MADHFADNTQSQDQAPGDKTVASPALGYGMERLDFFDTRAEEDDSDQPSQGMLSRNEVAAVSVDRSFYVSDVPSPYLSQRQAREDVQQTKRRHSTIATIITLLLVCAALGGIGWFLWNALHTSEPTVVEHYETAPIEKGEFLETIDTTSLVRPVSETSVASDASGTVAEVFVSNGQNVMEGDALLRLDNPTVAEALTKAQEAIAPVQVQADEKNQALEAAQVAVDAAQTAADAAPQDAAAQALLTAAQTNLATAQAAADAVNAALLANQQILDQAREQQERLTVRAPASGTVSDLNQDTAVGKSVSGATRICVISDVSRYRIDVEVPERYRDRVVEGQEVRLNFPAADNLQMVKAVTYLSDAGDLRLASVVLDEPDERITLGMAAEASVILQSIPDSLIVPLEAIRTAEDGSTHLDVLLDPSRGINTDVTVEIVATNDTQAAVTATNIQAGNAVIIATEE